MEGEMLAKIVVTVVGLALIVFVNWYFLLSRRKRN
jgi:plastocyanin domain-containing protein